jgi:cytochrome c oxidase assembly protein Cox11
VTTQRRLLVGGWLALAAVVVMLAMGLAHTPLQVGVVCFLAGYTVRAQMQWLAMRHAGAS